MKIDYIERLLKCLRKLIFNIRVFFNLFSKLLEEIIVSSIKI